MRADRVWHKSSAWLVKSKGGVLESVIGHPPKSNLELQVYRAKKQVHFNYLKFAAHIGELKLVYIIAGM